MLRHRLTPATRARDALDVARSLVAIHSTDAVTVFLSVQARTASVTPADIERTLYDDRSLVRVLCMRRTLFAVPRALVPVVYAACTRTIAARERRRLEQLLLDSGISVRPAAWLARGAKAALRALEARGEASTTELAADVPVLAKRLRVGVGTRFEATQSIAARLLPQLSMEGLVLRGRPRGSWINGSTAGSWPRPGWGARSSPARQAQPRPSCCGTGWRHSDPAPRRTSAGGRAGRPARPAPRSRGSRTRRSTWTVPPGSCSRTTSTPSSGRSRGQRSCPRSTRRRWAGRSATGIGPHAPTLFDGNGNAGPTVWWDGRVVGGWSQRRDGEIVHRLLEDVGADAVRAVESEAERVAAWLGDVRFSPGFLPPFQRALAS